MPGDPAGFLTEWVGYGSLAPDDAGNLYLGGAGGIGGSGLLVKRDADGTRSIVAGQWQPFICLYVDGRRATDVCLGSAEAVVVDHAGNLYFADRGSYGYDGK